MKTITYSEYLDMLRDIDVPDDTIAAYSMPRRAEGSAFAVDLVPNPDLVEMTEADLQFENALHVGNGAARVRRRLNFERRGREGDKSPVLVSEGDSWFQFPIILNETVDHLNRPFRIWSVGAAGDTAQNMVHDNPEFMRALRAHKSEVKGFLFSAAGNDVIGEDPKTGRPVLFDMLRNFNGNTSDATGHINMALLGRKLAFLRDAYGRVIATIRAEPGLSRLPIFIHGYDYVFPFPFGANDRRDPKWADKDQWLGAPMAARGLHDPEHRRKILKVLIDALYDMLDDLAGNSRKTGVWLVDCRGCLPSVTDWADEIHATSAGFLKVANRFKRRIDTALAEGGTS